MPIEAVLQRSHDLGLLGPGSVDPHVRHAGAFSALIPLGARMLDLGSGGGVPGLVVAVERLDLDVVLLDAGARRIAFLRWAVRQLDLGDRVAVAHGRAETLGHDPGLRETFDVVVARSFAAPAATAECASGFLRVGGVALVSEPPADDVGDDESTKSEGTTAPRWSRSGLAQLGLRDDGYVATVDATIRVLTKMTVSPAASPRTAGIPERRPLF